VLQQLLNHNDDLRRLVDKGYAVDFDSNYLIVRDIPYLDKDARLQIGAFVAKLVFVNENKVSQDDHQIFFAGTEPYNIDKTPIAILAGGPKELSLSPACSDIVVQRSFSNKPQRTGAYSDFFEKVEGYAGIIAGPAMEIYGTSSPLTFRPSKGVALDSVFKLNDTLTSRAEIKDLAEKFKDDVIAVIGLGGTGAYLLDFLVRTPVREIRGFDADRFHVHTGFRSPGRLDAAELGKSKAEIYQARYEPFRHGLTVQSKFIDASCGKELEGVTFAFVCVDSGPSRAGIFDLLLANHIPFIDVGMGLKRRGAALNGMLRVTYYSAEHGEATRAMGLANLEEDKDDVYRTNIQIGEINSLNASLAIIKFKQIRGFYFDEDINFHLLQEIGDLKIVGESR